MPAHLVIALVAFKLIAVAKHDQLLPGDEMTGGCTLWFHMRWELLRTEDFAHLQPEGHQLPGLLQKELFIK